MMTVYPKDPTLLAEFEDTNMVKIRFDMMKLFGGTMSELVMRRINAVLEEKLDDTPYTHY